MDATAREDRDQSVLEPFVQTQIQRRAKRLIGRNGFVATDREDIEQCLRLELLRRAHAFDPQRATWHGFVTLVLRRAVSRLLRARHREKRDYRRNSLLQTSDPRLANHLPDKRNGDADLVLDLAACEARLPANLQAIGHSLRSESVSASARAAGLPRSTFRERVGKVRKIYESAGLRIYVE